MEIEIFQKLSLGYHQSFAFLVLLGSIWRTHLRCMIARSAQPEHILIPVFSFAAHAHKILIHLHVAKSWKIADASQDSLARMAVHAYHVRRAPQSC
jgi:hypothetical protein